MTKVREDFKGSKRKTKSYKGTLIRIPADLSAETSQSRRDCLDIFKVSKGKIL